MTTYALIILVAYLVTLSFTYSMKWLNYRHLKKHGLEIPAGFEDIIDETTLKRTMAYSIEYTRFGFVVSIFSNIIMVIFLFGGLLDYYNSWIASLGFSAIVSGILFFLLLSYANTIISMPFDLYSTFKIEKKYDFNTQTIGLWITDFIKSLLISTILIGLVLAGAFWLITSSPQWWWLWVWGFFLVFSLFIMYISPYIIEPLFNKYEPLAVEGLEDTIKALMSKAGIRVSRVFQMDASKRSKHTNAYFSGIGKTKRIVLFDTLLEKMAQGEILAILGHEAGHWKKKHVLKAIIISEVFSFIGIYIAFRILQTDTLADWFGILHATIQGLPLVGFILLGFIASILNFPFRPISTWFSRRNERQADRFACDLVGDSEGMVSALIKLSKDNLANLHPHPLFAAFYYSHPPILQRIKQLREFTPADDVKPGSANKAEN